MTANQRYLLWLGFDGSLFHGLAKAGGTGYGCLDFLEPVLDKVLKNKYVERVSVHPCSRTDTGVHVLRAPVVLNVPAESKRLDHEKDVILKDLNDTCQTFYPNSVKLSDLNWVSPGFCARRHALYRRYVFRCRVAKSRDVYETHVKQASLSCFSERFHCWTIPPGFDMDRANKGCDLFKGKHNLASFLKESVGKRNKEENEVRQHTEKIIDLIRFTPGEPITAVEDPLFDYYNFEVISRSFLREQIRRTVRMVVKAGYDDRYLEHIKIALRYPDPQTFIQLGHRAAGGKGLYLVDVVYDTDNFLNPQPYYTHSIDREGFYD